MPRAFRRSRLVGYCLRMIEVAHPFARQARPSTIAAEGMPRWRWTLDDIERLAKAGVFTEFDRVELIGGELVPMSPKGNHHEHLRTELSDLLPRLLPAQYKVGSEPQFNLAEDQFRNPDIMIFPAGIRVHDVRGPTALLVVEVSDTSFDSDTTGKAATYCSFGVREYWVIEAISRETVVFRDPTPNGYQTRFVVPETAPLRALLIPELDLRLDAID
jgi:Uma2 family endonuclease